jgi:hypothetical protein
MTTRSFVAFDAVALYDALEYQRLERGLTWQGVANQVWDLSSVLNAQRGDHPLSVSTIKNLGLRRATSCQHALFLLRWLDRTPESFLKGASRDAGSPLPRASNAERPRWNLHRLYEVLNATRKEEGITWQQLARELRCTPHQLTGLRTAKFAIDMALAMCIVQWLARPASDFIDVATW